MAGEKTEQPTAHRLQDARKKGQVFKSQDVTQAAAFLAATGILAGGGSIIAEQLSGLVRESFRPELFRTSLEPVALLNVLTSGFTRFLFVTTPVVTGIALVSALVIFLQVKPLFSPEVVKPKFDKLNPIEGFRNLFFKAKTYVDLGKNLLKFGLILAIVYVLVRSYLPEVAQSVRLGVPESFGLAGTLVKGLLLRAGGVFLLIGAADFMLQKKFHMKSLMMSKEEVKQEHKQEEGDPHIKHMRKHIAQEMVLGGAAVKVPKAAVVVVNPVHIAVALDYDSKNMGAPQVVAKGRGEMAAKIRAIADEHKVPVVQNIPLARSLFTVELDREVPEDLYEAVAEVLNWVFEMKQKQKQESEQTAL